MVPPMLQGSLVLVLSQRHNVCAVKCGVRKPQDAWAHSCGQALSDDAQGARTEDHVMQDMTDATVTPHGNPSDINALVTYS